MLRSGTGDGNRSEPVDADADGIAESSRELDQPENEAALVELTTAYATTPNRMSPGCPRASLAARSASPATADACRAPGRRPLRAGPALGERGPASASPAPSRGTTALSPRG